MSKTKTQFSKEQLEKAKKLANLMFMFKKICNEKEAYFATLFELTPVEFRCVKYLYGREYVIVKELAKLMNLKPSRITRIITSLESKNFIKRTLDEEDRRNVRVMLNSGKKEKIEEMEKAYTELHQEILSPLNKNVAKKSIADLEVMYDLFEKWVVENIRESKK